ncbi:MAG: Do family serine endopeptidase [Chthoniobacteraceae bacterium]
MKRFILFVLLVVLGLLALSRWNQRRQTPVSFTPAKTEQLNLGELPSLAAVDDETTRLIQAVVPSVVSITTSRKVKEPIIDPFEYFFGRRGQRGEKAPSSLGSGVIVSKEGHILTNYHVVADVDEVLVQLSDGRAPYPARIIGGDEKSDIAVIQIDAKGLRPLPLGDSDQVKVGQLVFAIGNPFGLQETVTKGIISATGRVTDEFGEYFQTEAVINPGNSGGPLINRKGEIIGINTAIGNYSGTGTWQGVGFAIPSNNVRRALEGILKNGRVAHGYLGVAIVPLTPELAAQLGVTTQNGAVVRDVSPGSPAQKAGLAVDDVLIGFNGKPIKDSRDLVRQVANSTVGSKVELKLIRGGKEMTLSLTLEEPPPGMKLGPTQPQAPQQPQQTPQFPQLQPQQKPAPAPGSSPLSGITVSEIPAGEASRLPGNVQGVYVTAVAPAAPSAGSLQPGDVIEQVNNHPVPDPAAFQALAARLPEGRPALFSIARGKVRSFVVVQAIR